MDHKKLPRIAFIFSLLLSNPGLTFHAHAETLASTYGPTLNTDSLLTIAAKLKPSEDISNYQMMIALYKNNPKAFYTENMNSLKTGAKLEAPSESAIRATTPEEARRIYTEHNLAWKARKEESKTSSVAEKSADVLALAPTLPSNDLKETLSLPLRVTTEEAAPITSESENKSEAKKETAEKPLDKAVDKKATHSKQTDAAPTLAALSASVKGLTEKVEDLSSQLASKQEELTNLQQEVHQLKKEAFSSGVVASLPEEGRNNNLTYLLAGLSFGFSILVGLGTWGFMRYRKANSKPVAKKVTKRKPRITKQQTLAKEQSQEPREEKIRLTPPLLQDYNFQEEKASQREEINKEEAVLNKLDLASAYIEMGEHEEAVIILQEILEEGNNTQRNEAKNLLSKIEMVS